MISGFATGPGNSVDDICVLHTQTIQPEKASTQCPMCQPTPFTLLCLPLLLLHCQLPHVCFAMQMVQDAV